MCSRIWAVFFILAGGVLLLDNLGYTHWRLGAFWPLWLIGAGLALLLMRLFGPARGPYRRTSVGTTGGDLHD